MSNRGVCLQGHAPSNSTQMCVIIIKQKQNKIAMQTLENASLVNPHGLGVTWLDTFKTDYLDSSEYAVLDTERPFIAHFRYATIGKVCKENTHPFVCGKNIDELFMMNGTVKGYGNKDMTDTQDIANKLGDMPRASWKKFLSKFKAVRFVSVNTKNKSFQIYNRDLFTYKDGVWYSKTNIFRDNVVAVYGTLKRGHGNYMRCLQGESIYMGGAVTADKYPLIIDGLPFLSPKQGIGHHVEVDVFRVDDDTFARLDHLESHPRWYVREQVPVVLDNGRRVVTAWVYFNDVSIEGKEHHKSYERVAQPRLFAERAEPFQPTIDEDDCFEVADAEFSDDGHVCPTCFADVEYDGFNNYHCGECDTWHAEKDLIDISDTIEDVFKFNDHE